jgi:23S rRNA pseudoU1915 N3-methylase RlmH
MQGQAQLATNNNINKNNSKVKKEKKYKVLEVDNATKTTKTSKAKKEPHFVNNAKNILKAIRDNKQEVKGTIALRKRGKSSKKATFALVICKLLKAKGKELIR